MFEYKVVPAPTRGLKAKGVKGTQARFANAVQTMMNELGTEGWEYQRTDTLPVEERQGLTGKTTTFQNLLVFRRPLLDDVETPNKVAALIEDQSGIQEDDIEDRVEDDVDYTLPEPQEPKTATADTAPEDETSDVAARVEETLKADTFAFPWSRQSKSSKSDKDETQLPAE